MFRNKSVRDLRDHLPNDMVIIRDEVLELEDSSRTPNRGLGLGL